jgi:hypothetical protein
LDTSKGHVQDAFTFPDPDRVGREWVLVKAGYIDHEPWSGKDRQWMAWEEVGLLPFGSSHDTKAAAVAEVVRRWWSYNRANNTGLPVAPAAAEAPEPDGSVWSATHGRKGEAPLGCFESDSKDEARAWLVDRLIEYQQTRNAYDRDIIKVHIGLLATGAADMVDVGGSDDDDPRMVFELAQATEGGK